MKGEFLSAWLTNISKSLSETYPQPEVWREAGCGELDLTWDHPLIIADWHRCSKITWLLAPSWAVQNSLEYFHWTSVTRVWCYLCDVDYTCWVCTLPAPSVCLFCVLGAYWWQLWPQNLLAQLIAQLWHQAIVTRDDTAVTLDCCDMADTQLWHGCCWRKEGGSEFCAQPVCRLLQVSRWHVLYSGM